MLDRHVDSAVATLLPKHTVTCFPPPTPHAGRVRGDPHAGRHPPSVLLTHPPLTTTLLTHMHL